MAPCRARIVIADQQALFRKSLTNYLTNGGDTVLYVPCDGDKPDRYDQPRAEYRGGVLLHDPSE
jgi:hypothetical protein